MGHFSLILIALGILVFSLFSGRLKNSILTLPLAFVLFGFALNLFGQSDVVDVLEHPAIRTLFESTLILVLFSDASRIDLR